MPLNSWRKWLDRAFGLTRTPPIRRPIRPRLEVLEERWVPAITAAGQAASLVEGAANAVVVATFTDSTPSPSAGYTANINWGDATSSAGAVSLTGATFSVTGTHTYAEETPAASPHAVTVVITETVGDMDAATATGSAAVSDAPLRVDAGPAFNASEGATASPVLATFTDANPGDHTADFSTAINWGDGTAIDASSGAVSYDAGTGVYTVTGSHAYVEEGSYFASVRITDVGGFAVDTGVGLDANGAVMTAASQTAGAWYPDRFPPNGFVGGQTDFGRTGVIDQTISAADADGNRPAAFNSGFYDFQGRKYDLPPGATYVTMDLYVPASYAALDQTDPAGNPASYGSVASLWGTGVDSTNTVTSFPIIGFNNLGTNNGNTGSAGFEVFDQTKPGGWTDVPGFTGYDQWYQLSIGGVVGGDLVYFVNGALVYTDTTVTGTTAISNEILQGYNGGSATAQTYDIFWNPVQDTPASVADQQIENLVLAAPGFAPPEGGSIGGPFTGVATFTDPAGQGVETAADFSATINWGDGVTDAATVVSDGSGNYHVNIPDHTYADEGAYKLSVTVTHDLLPPVTSNTRILTVNEADNLAPAGSQPTIPGITEGGSVTGTVAIFTDTGYPTNPASDFTATIDWGDGTTDAGAAVTITSDGAGNFTVSGSHTYADEGDFTVSATLSDDAPGTSSATASNTAAVAEGDTLTATGGSVSGITEGASAAAVLALFGDTYTGNTASDFTASIDWGDGTVTAGTVSGGSGSFTVSGSHTYADEGAFNPIVTLSDDAPGTAKATATSTATVAEADTLAAVSVQPNATLTEGSSTSGDIAVFSDAGYPTNDPGDFTATIDWGDGTVTSGTVSAAGDGNFTVSGSHAYAEEGSFTATVTLADDAPGTDSATATSTVTVSEADTLSVTATPVFATEGTPFSGAVVATFSDTNTANTAGDFTATIFWGDGTSSTGTVSGAGGSFIVTASHTYFDEGIFTPTVFVADDAPGTATGSASGSAFVFENDSLTGTAAGFSTTEGQSFSGQVATFTDTTYPSNPASDFTATIDWGDGTSSTGTVVGGGGGTFNISGDHTYADEGTFTVTVILADDTPGSTSASATATATVFEGDFGTLTPLTITPTEGHAFSGAVATFTDEGNPSQPASDWIATIDWGDGSPTTTATVSGPTGGPFTISGTHTYVDEGGFTIVATFSDDPPSTLTDIPISSSTGPSAIVAEGDVLSPATGQPTVAPTEGTSFSGGVAVFSDTGYPGNTAADFTATIDWGDGTTDSGAAVTVTGGSGLFTVSGSHTYADEGAFTANVTLTDVDDDGSGQATAASSLSVTVNVAEGDVLSGTLAAVSGTEGTGFSGTVATFSDTNTSNVPGDFTATIDWGDGTTDSGAAVSVGGGSGTFTVSGSHTYFDEGSFTATVVLTDDAPGTAKGTASGAVTVAEGDALPGTLAAISATEGTAFSGTVATFNDADTHNFAPDFTATIHWGDGTSSAGTVSVPFFGSGLTTVLGSHTYFDEGSFTVTVVLTDDAPGTATGTASSAVSVAEADVLNGSASPIQTTEGTAVTGKVATFTDSYAGNTAGDFTATINWGDGTTTAGTVSGGSGAFTVSGSHTYTASGTFTAAVTLSDDAPGTATATATVAVSVSGDVVVPGTNGDDTLVLTETPGGGVGSITYVLNGGPPVTLTGVHSFTFDGLGGNDTMVVDAVNGTPLVPGGVFYDGGAGSNTLTINANGEVVQTEPGAITLADASTVQYTNTQTTDIDSAAAEDAIAGPDTSDRDTAFIGLNPQERFVQAVYLDELGRAGSKAELDGWAALFNSGGTQQQAQAAIAFDIQHSAEGRDHLVKSWYLGFLGRAAQGGEEQGFVNLLQQGASEEQALSLILGSAEFYARAQTLFGTANADENYVRALYLVLLDRPASSGEAAGLTAAVAQLGRTNLARAFLTSQEFRTDDFEGYYNALLHRPSDPNGRDPAGLNGWVFSNLDVGSVRVAFESSAEFFVDG